MEVDGRFVATIPAAGLVLLLLETPTFFSGAAPLSPVLVDWKCHGRGGRKSTKAHGMVLPKTEEPVRFTLTLAFLTSEATRASKDWLAAALDVLRKQVTRDGFGVLSPFWNL